MTHQESYNLREVSELLGISRRTLQRHLQEGAFPGRFLALGSDGLEIRVPGEDVRALLDGPRGRGLESDVPLAPRRLEMDSLVPYSSGAALDPISATPVYASALTHSDLESLRDAVLAIVREERDAFMGAVRAALEARDQEIHLLRDALDEMRHSVDGVRQGLESVERQVTSAWRASEVQPWNWAEALGSIEPEGVDVDRLLRELAELEAMVGPSRD